jgi:hypothetical protein
MSGDLKQKFKELSAALIELHRQLLMLEAKKLASESGRPMTPYELLHASLNDPKLAWLRFMSELIVNIDTIVDETPNLSSKEASQVADEVSNLLEKPQTTDNRDFWTGYSKYLSENPDIIMKHSQVKALLTNLRPKM